MRSCLFVKGGILYGNDYIGFRCFGPIAAY